MHTGLGPSPREKGFEGFSKGQTRLGHRSPGQPPGAGLGLQVGIREQQHGGRGCGVEGGRWSVARFQETELTGPGPLKGFRSRNLWIRSQITGAGLAHRGKLAEQSAEAHG
jgi:hypothetical protein